LQHELHRNILQILGVVALKFVIYLVVLDGMAALRVEMRLNEICLMTRCREFFERKAVINEGDHVSRDRRKLVFFRRRSSMLGAKEYIDTTL
jgi:hypothetical protein